MGTSNTEKLAVVEKQNQLFNPRKGLEEQDIHSLVQRGLSFKRLLFPGIQISLKKLEGCCNRV
jgi:hypothetical protein